jgi:hypothetical protein
MAHISLSSLAAHRCLAGLSKRQLGKHADFRYQRSRPPRAGGDSSQTPLGVLSKISDAINVAISDLLTDVQVVTAEALPIEHVTLDEARLLRKIPTRPTAAAALSKTERELTSPGA